MNKGLEALKRLVGWFGIPPEVDKRALCYKDIETIEKELKALEIIKEKIKIDFNDHYFGIKGNYYIIVNNDVFGAIKVDKEQYELIEELINEQK